MIGSPAVGDGEGGLKPTLRLIGLFRVAGSVVPASLKCDAGYA